MVADVATISLSFIVVNLLIAGLIWWAVTEQ
jgi:hypothetical protein